MNPSFQNIKKNIFAIGAFDRFNYGDFLFPIVSKNFINAHQYELNFDSYALIESDYSQFDALKTKAISNLYLRNGVSDGDIIYFCGGGILGSSWCAMHANLLDDRGNFLLYYFQKIFGYKFSNNFSRLYFGAKSEFPWIASPNDFTARVKVIYNAVGGSELSEFPEEYRLIALEKLSKASYLSVRDTETKKQCASIEDRVTVHLSPDSAVLMSEQFPLEILKSRISPELLKLISAGDYVCFHCNYSYAKKHEAEIIVQLEKIYSEKGLRALLLPIGRYVGLDDQKGLANLKNKITTPTDMVSDQANVWEIMFTIASASLFIGTSLHGNVTAQSFAVPHIGLSSKRSKLDFYLETWDIPEQAFCANVTDISQIANSVLAVPDWIRQQKRAELIDIASKNLHNIMQIAIS